ncbi:MAG: hypothetical protein ACI4J7_10735 [Ruminiclostridium sp.]
MDTYVNVLHFSSSRKLITLFSSIPFTMRFCSELRSGITSSVIARSSKKSYIRVHAVLCFIFAFITAFIGIVFCVGVLGIFFPIGADRTELYDYGYWILLNKNSTAWQYILATAFHFSLSVGMWSLSGIALSAFFPDPFIALCTPVVMSYVLEFVSMEIDFLPDLWNLSVSNAGTGITDNIIIESLYITTVFAVMALIFAELFCFAAKRRLCHEKT